MVELNIDKNYFLKELLDSNKDTSISDIANVVEGKLEKDKELINNAIEILSSYMINIPKLANNQNLYYSYKQKLIRRKNEIMNDAIFMVKQLDIYSKEVTDSFKFGRITDPGTNRSIIPKNDTERKIYNGYELRDFTSVIKTLDSHIEYLESSIKNIQDMIYGIELSYKMDEKRQLS